YTTLFRSLVEDLVHRLHEGEVQGPTQVFGDVLEVLLVPPRQDHALDAGAPGGEHLLLDAADRQDLAAQGDLAGHGKVRTDRAAGQQRGERGGDGDHGRRPVLRDGGGRQVGG